MKTTTTTTSPVSFMEKYSFWYYVVQLPSQRGGGRG